jgi:hypothetical protein
MPEIHEPESVSKQFERAMRRSSHSIQDCGAAVYEAVSTFGNFNANVLIALNPCQ